MLPEGSPSEIKEPQPMGHLVSHGPSSSGKRFMHVMVWKLEQPPRKPTQAPEKETLNDAHLPPEIFSEPQFPNAHRKALSPRVCLLGTISF